MPEVIEFMNFYLSTCMVAGMVFMLRSVHKALHVGLIRYTAVLVVSSIAWPIFVGRNYW